MTSDETDELITAAAFMHVRREELARQFLNQERWAGTTVFLAYRASYQLGTEPVGLHSDTLLHLVA